MKILIVDDHSLLVEGLINLLKAEGVEVVGATSSGAEAIQTAKASSPDVMLLDIQSPEVDGLETISRVKAEFPAMKVVVFTMLEDTAFLLEAIRRGASGYLLKSTSTDEFMDLLACVERGETALTRSMTTVVMREYARRAECSEQDAELTGLSHTSTTTLTPRQADIFDRLAKGRTYREISKDLGIQPRTVGYHVHSILQKLQLRNRAQIIAFAQRS